MSASAFASAPIRITGEYSIRADAAIQRPALSHTYTLQASDAIVPDHQADADAAAVQPAPKAQRATAHTFATRPSDLPPSCPREPMLTQLAALVRQAGQESDRYLTSVMKDEEERKKAANPNPNPNPNPAMDESGDAAAAAGKQQRKRKAKSSEDGEGGEEEGDPEEDGDNGMEAQERKPKNDQ
jgi:hypothetical protein